MTKLKPKKQKNKRKKTDEGLSENIDLSKNAYEEIVIQALITKIIII